MASLGLRRSVEDKTLKARLIISVATLLALSHVSSAFAQSSSRQRYLVCTASTGIGGNHPFENYSTEIFEVGYDDVETVRKADAEWKAFSASFKSNSELYFRRCDAVDARKTAESMNTLVDGTRKQDSILRRVDWAPSFIIPQSIIKSITLDFEPGDKSFARSGRGGYQSASIKLKYRFLLCAGEIQIAYALDRKSLEHSTYYIDRFNGINPNTMTPQSEPPVPIAVPINFGVYVKGGTVQYRYETKLADVRDKIAGEAVGMGCFTGQTKTIGTVAKLLGPDPKIKTLQVKAFLDQLILKEPFGNYTLDFPLVNPDVPAPPPPAPRPRAAIRRKAH